MHLALPVHTSRPHQQILLAIFIIFKRAGDTRYGLGGMWVEPTHHIPVSAWLVLYCGIGTALAKALWSLHHCGWKRWWCLNLTLFSPSIFYGLHLIFAILTHSLSTIPLHFQYMCDKCGLTSIKLVTHRQFQSDDRPLFRWGTDNSIDEYPYKSIQMFSTSPVSHLPAYTEAHSACIDCSDSIRFSSICSVLSLLIKS